MAEKQINTRIKLKYDTYDNWITNNPVLLKGEIAIATVATKQNGVVNTVPSVLLKAGDGTNKYQDLGFIYGRAADVYDWAKAATKPSYTANEISGLADYIAGEIEDTDTTYQIVKVDNYNYKLQSKDKGATAWVDVSAISIPKYDDTTIKADVSSLKELVGETAVATQIANAIAALDLENTYEQKGAAASALTSAKAYADGKDANIKAAKDAADNAQADVDDLKGKVGTVATGKTVVQMIEDAKTAATYDDTEIKGKISTLQGTDINKSARAIAAEEVAKIVAGADTAYDTLKEVADWISSHTDDAASMNSAIVALQGLVGGTSVDSQIKAAINALKIGDYAKAADLTALAARVTTAEGKITNLETHALLDSDTYIFDCGNSAV